MKNGFFQGVYEIVKQIPRGKVMTYGQIANLLNRPRGARIVAWALHANPDPKNVPCHRVVNRYGMISSGFAFGGPHIQRDLLEQEGVIFDGEDKIDFKQFGYNISTKR